jgi:hypothetical protein
VEATSHNPVFSGGSGTEWPQEPALVVGRTLDHNRERRSPTNEADKARPFSPIRILWIALYALMMLAFDWEAGFQFNARPSTLNRTLAGALSVIGFVFCVKMIWKELTSSKTGSGTGADG